MLGLSGEHLLILFIVTLIFGPKHLPEAGRTLGKAIRNLKDHFKGIHEPEFRRLDGESKRADRA
jgi:sec-independent protein translocase protein TatA